MNKKLLVLLAGVVLVAAACNNQTAVAPATNTNTQTQAQTNTEPQTAANVTSQTSLKGLISGGSNQTCTYVDGQNSGTVYATSGKARVDIVAVSKNVSTTMHSIIDGQTSYTWIDGQPSGFKTSITATPPASSSTNTQASAQVDANKQMTYNCSSWSADSSKFVLPGNVQFMDMSSIKIPTK